MIGKKKIDVVRIELVKEGSVLYGDSDIRKLKIIKPEDAVKLASSFFDGADREKIYICALDGSMKPINVSLVGMGGMSECVIHMPEIFKTAILANCPNIICLHNHLSGNVEPSDEDKKITLRMQVAGKIMGIKLQDHIIVGEGGQFFSFQKEGLIADGEWALNNEERLAG